ncbi:MAG: tripartite tricarboxylate transporter substrate-binding protein [Beijerinckiaceae bacterium]|nr:tripartite tricarboxylate transporter substrate-binding protein [Beijerinckiaceae bacterium]
MRVIIQSLQIGATALAFLNVSQPAFAQQSGEFYKGKTITVVVGLNAGGTVDLFARMFSQYLQKHIPTQPPIVVQNMPGAGGLLATNFVSERAKPDGLTILWGPWDPLAQAMKLPNMRARYENFEFLGGTGDTRVLYARTDIIPGGMKKPADIAKAGLLNVGALNPTDPSGLLAHLALGVLGVKDKLIIGYRGGNDVFLAMQRGEVQFHSTSITTFRSRNADFIKSGQGMGIAYLAPVDASGNVQANPFITEMPAFPDLYREIHGKAPSGALWDATNWLVNQIGEMTFVGLAPRGVPAEALAELRAAYAAAANDSAFTKQSVSMNGLPYSFVNVARGQQIFASLANVSPEVLDTLKQVVDIK